MGAIERTPGGAPLHNPVFPVGSAGFTALVAWNATELAGAIGDADLAQQAQELAEAVDQRWDPTALTWVDDGPTERGSGRIRTLDAMLPLLVRPRPEALGALVDPGAFGAPFGPRGVHAAEPTYQPGTYWRGSSWPQLTYLLWVAARREGAREADALGRALQAGAVTSGFAEHWDPGSGAPLGAVPQTWAALAAVVDGPGCG